MSEFGINLNPENRDDTIKVNSFSEIDTKQVDSNDKDAEDSEQQEN